jgi:phosphomannomutase
VGLPLQALPVLLGEPSQRERAGATFQHGGQVRDGPGIQHHQPAPVLAAGADHGDQRPLARDVGGGPVGDDPAGTPLPAVDQVRGGRRVGDELMGQGLQHHRAAGQAGDLRDNLLGRRPGHRQTGEDLVDPFGCLKLPHPRVDDEGVRRLGDPHKRRLALEHGQRQPAPPRGGHQRRRGRTVTANALHDQPGHPGVGEIVDVAGQPGIVGRQGDAGGEDKLAAGQQLGDVGHLGHVDPADDPAQPGRAGHHARAAQGQFRQLQQVGNSRARAAGQRPGPAPVVCTHGRPPSQRRLTLCQNIRAGFDGLVLAPVWPAELTEWIIFGRDRREQACELAPGVSPALGSQPGRPRLRAGRIGGMSQHSADAAARRRPDGPGPDPEPLRAAARAWIADDPDPVTRAELADLLRAADLDGLAARFGAPLAFGTAGLRGPLGAGPARMNRATVRRVAAGLARYLRAEVPAAGRAPVVIGYDARRGSAEFAAEAAAVLTGAGLRAARLPGPLPTPVLAFAVRHLGAVAGVMVTASHNPRGDNGCKVYWSDGAQIIPPADAGIAAAAEQAGPLREIPLGGPGDRLGGEVLDAYLGAIVPAALHGPGLAAARRALRVAYTPLHGVGLDTYLQAFRRGGFREPAVVAAQAEPDGDFPTLPRPNPEEPGALDLLIEEGTRAGADLLIANDPDADRVAAAIPDRAAATGWRVLTGDEIGALLARHLLAHEPHPARRLLVTTVVSAGLLGRMAAAAGARYAETLTGFKWIMRAGATDPGSEFLFGYEEALGYAVTGIVRDKDGISAALTLAEAAAVARQAGRTLADDLDDLARRHGLYATGQLSVELPPGGPAGGEVLRALRSAPPAALIGQPVTAVDDLAGGTRTRPGEPAVPLGLPRSDVLIWRCADGTRVAVRPSGTEPKVKVYLQVVQDTGGRGDLAPVRAEAAARLAALRQEVSEALKS